MARGAATRPWFWYIHQSHSKGPLWYGCVMETIKLISLFCNVFAIFEAFGRFWKLTVFGILNCFDTENTFSENSKLLYASK